MRRLIKRLQGYLDAIYHERVLVFEQWDLELGSQTDLIRVHIAQGYLLEAVHCFEALKMV